MHTAKRTLRFDPLSRWHKTYEKDGRLIMAYSGKGLIKVNGKPLHLVEPQILRFKVYEPVLLVGLDKFGMQPQFSNMEEERCMG